MRRSLFTLDGNDAPAGFRLHLPADTFEQPPVEIDGVQEWPVSPLSLAQIRVGIAVRGAFGELSEKQRRSLARLKGVFFPDRADEDLMPPVTSLPVA